MDKLIRLINAQQKERSYRSFTDYDEAAFSQTIRAALETADAPLLLGVQTL